MRKKTLKQNIDFLKRSVRHLLKNKTIGNKQNILFITMVIPAKGYGIKIHFQNISEKWIRKELRENFPNSIFNGSYAILFDNINNEIF